MIIFLILLLLIILVSVFILYKIILWISKKETRVIWAMSLIGILFVAKVVDLVFFTKMEVIESKVYSGMYFIKNPVKNKDSIHSIIKQIAINRMNQEFLGNEEKYRNFNADSSSVSIIYDLDFYNYTDNFLGSNTAHFIENEEDDGGPTSIHFLSEIQDEKIATFSIDFCENDTVNYYAKMTYHHRYYRRFKTDTLINHCPKLPKKAKPIEFNKVHSTKVKAGVEEYPKKK